MAKGKTGYSTHITYNSMPTSRHRDGAFPQYFSTHYSWKQLINETTGLPDNNITCSDETHTAELCERAERERKRLNNARECVRVYNLGSNGLGHAKNMLSVDVK